MIGGPGDKFVIRGVHLATRDTSGVRYPRNARLGVAWRDFQTFLCSTCSRLHSLCNLCAASVCVRAPRCMSEYSSTAALGLLSVVACILDNLRNC